MGKELTMAATPKVDVKFKHRQLDQLCHELFSHAPNEAFGMLLCETVLIESGSQTHAIVKVHRHHRFSTNGATTANPMNVSIDRDEIKYALDSATKNSRINCVIDVHTHPFDKTGATFSSIDDQDEHTFCQWLTRNYPQFDYGSIVFSPEFYSARFWRLSDHNFYTPVTLSLIHI